MKKCALIGLILALCAGCVGWRGSVAPSAAELGPEMGALPEASAHPVMPALTPLLTPEAAPESTPEPEPFRLPAARGSNEVSCAVIGDYWVSAENDNRLISRRLGADAGEAPTVLCDDTNMLFWVAGDYAAVYAKPDADTPYRIVLYKPDGSEKIVLPFRQDEFIGVKWADEDYAYEDAGMIRRVNLKTMERETLFRVDHPMWGRMGENIVTVDFASDAIVLYPPDTAKDALRLDIGFDIMAVIALGEGILVQRSEDLLFIGDDLTARDVGGTASTNRPWSDYPNYAAGHRATPDALGEMYTYFLIGPEGVYPTETMPLPGEGFDGTLPRIDATLMIPMERYPAIDLEVTPLAR